MPAERFLPHDDPSRAVPWPADFVSLVDDNDGLRIVVASVDDPSHVFSIQFPFRRAYRVTDEGDRLASMRELSGKSSVGFYEEVDSEWLRWFFAESMGVPVEQGLRHWVVVTSDEIVDVIAVDPPTVLLSADG